MELFNKITAPMQKKAIDFLESASIRRTQFRVAILDVLLKTPVPLTQNQIAKAIDESAPNKTTIYRTLAQLVEKGLVYEAFLENRSQHYELAHNCDTQCCHPLFTCRRCGQTQCLSDVRADILPLPKGFVLQRHQIHIEGICSKCTN